MPKIRFHHDADGITTAYLSSFGIKGSVLDGWDGKFGDTTGLKAGDWMVDMRPMQNMEGLNVIDHHTPHREDRKYNAILDEVPASLIAYRKLKSRKLLLITSAFAFFFIRSILSRLDFFVPETLELLLAVVSFAGLILFSLAVLQMGRLWISRRSTI